MNDTSTTPTRWRLPDLRQGDRGFGDGLAAAFEMVVTPAIFGVLGYLLDRSLGITPVFTLIFTISVLCYVIWKFYAQYVTESDAELERWRAARAEAKRAQSGPRHG